LLNPFCSPLLPLADILRLGQATILLDQSTITPLDTGATGICERAAGPEGRPHRNFIPKFAPGDWEYSLVGHRPARNRECDLGRSLSRSRCLARQEVRHALFTQLDDDLRPFEPISERSMAVDGRFGSTKRDVALRADDGISVRHDPKFGRSVVGNGIQNLSCAILATENSHGVSYPLESQAREDCLFFPALGIPVAFSDVFLRAFVRSIGGKRAFSLPSAIGPK
jgi:hypothetical protein